MLPLLLALTTSAVALTNEATGGIGLELGIGTGGGGLPLRVGAGWQASAHWWTGRYDEVYALGRYWAFGATYRGDYTVDGLRTAPLLEIRRGNDLLVAGLHGFVAGGPVFQGDRMGVTARVGGGAKLRRHAFWGFTVRVEGGVELFGDQVGGQFGVMLGGAFARPMRKIDLGR